MFTFILCLSFFSGCSPPCPNSELSSETMTPFRHLVTAFRRRSPCRRVHLHRTAQCSSSPISRYVWLSTILHALKRRNHCDRHVLFIINNFLKLADFPMEDEVRERPGSQLMAILVSPSTWLRKPTWHGHLCWNVDKQSEIRHRKGTANVVTSHGGSNTGTSLVVRKPIKATEHHLLPVTLWLNRRTT
jgi:hypothetical protein